MEIKVECSEDALEHSVTDKLNPPSVFGSQSYLSDTKAAISMEDLHLESDSGTYLAKTGKEIHLTRHGIEFTDVQDVEKDMLNKRFDSKNVAQNNTNHLDQSEGNFYLELDTQVGLEKVNTTDKCDKDKVTNETIDGVVNDMHKNGHKLHQDDDELNQDNDKLNQDNDRTVEKVAMKSNSEKNHVPNTVDNMEPDMCETEKLLEYQRETLTDREVQENELDLSYRKPGSRICHICRMVGDLSVVKLIR